MQGSEINLFRHEKGITYLSYPLYSTMLTTLARIAEETA